MANLKDRLKKIQELRKSEIPRTAPQNAPQNASRNGSDAPVFSMPGWTQCGFQVLKRECGAQASLYLKGGLPQALAVLVPDLAGRDLPPPEDFLFFDLETTGLSGGAGTIAFLAAFGRFVKSGKCHKLRVTQYLLLDYPGENDFIEAVLKEFAGNSVIVSYNGKCFDSQILKMRCLMKGIKPPVYLHADLLHPARRLWKNIISDCSQASVETQILGIDRSGDIPGALAPEIWFEFLKTSNTERLAGICDHNLADICGLASILGAMVNIAADPFASERKYDIGRLALYWRGFCRRTGNKDLAVTGDRLLLAAAGNYPCLPVIKAAVFRALAIDAEKKLNDAKVALRFAEQGLKQLSPDTSLYREFISRVMRLEKRLDGIRLKKK